MKKVLVDKEIDEIVYVVSFAQIGAALTMWYAHVIDGVPANVILVAFFGG